MKKQNVLARLFSWKTNRNDSKRKNSILKK